MNTSHIILIAALVAAGFALLFLFEIRIVTYLKQMRDLLRQLVDKSR